jgi:hypothetical protein
MQAENGVAHLQFFRQIFYRGADAQEIGEKAQTNIGEVGKGTTLNRLAVQGDFSRKLQEKIFTAIGGAK